MATKAKRRTFSIKEKVSLIEEVLKPGATQVQVAQKHGIKLSTLHGIIKDKDKILSVVGAGQNSKHVMKGRQHDLEDRLHDWFLKKRSQGVLMDSPLLRKQALVLAQSMNLDEFKCSNGWLWRWRKRYGIKHKEEHGERQSADLEASKKWLEEELPILLASYSPKDVFNSDETGIFFRCLPRSGFVAHGETKPAGNKVAKDRLTCLVTANMDGSEKPKLLVIGKSAKPRNFPRDQTTLPVRYSHSKKAWMTGRIWEQFLQSWDRSLRSQNRKILLLVDNAPSHPVIHGLTNMKVVFLPKNTTSLIQPMDAGIIRNLKGDQKLS